MIANEIEQEEVKRSRMLYVWIAVILFVLIAIIVIIVLALK
jgi:hypothetical protein